ncbi:g11586 [Coccomyxa elongata]
MEDLDWPAGRSRSTFCQLDELAKCPICHDFYRVPLSLSCGHAYCSACIRSYLGSQELQGDAKCPQCRQACDSRDLRPCHPLKDLVEGYTAARLLLIQTAQLVIPAEPPQPLGRRMSQRVQKRQRSSQDEGAKHGTQQQPPQLVARKDRRPRQGPGSRETQDAGHASTRSASTFIDMTKEDCGRELRSGRAARSGLASDAREDGSDLDIELSLSSDSSWGSEPPSQKPKRQGGGNATQSNVTANKAAPKDSKLPPGFAECPACSMRVREALLGEHIDRYHPVGGNDDDFQESRKGLPVRKPTSLEVPPKVAFSMLKNKEVQAKLSFYGLPTDGKRQDWERRYNSFRVEVQTALDGEENVTMEQLARRVRSEERKIAAAAFIGSRSKKAEETVPGASSFEQLISTARARNAKKATAAQPQARSVPQPQQTLPSSGAAAQPKQEESCASDGMLATAAAAAAPSHVAALVSQGQGDVSDEGCREFSGQPVDSNAQPHASLKNGGHGKGGVQAPSACPGQQLQPRSGCSGQGQHPGAALAGDIRGGCEAEGGWGAAKVTKKAEKGVVFVHAAGQDMPGLQTRNDLGVDEVPDSDQDEQLA